MEQEYGDFVAVRSADMVAVPSDAGLLAPRTATSRIDYLDNLRALAMLLGVFLHAALAYAAPSQSIWLATDPGASVLIDAGVWLVHLFRMSLFFLLSGYFAKLVIDRRGVISFLRARLTRIAVPFVVFYPFLWAAMAGVFVFAASYTPHPSGLMGLILQAAQDQQSDVKNLETDPQIAAPTTMHLWFLYYLLFFAFLTPLLARFVRLRFTWLISWPRSLFVFPLVLVPGVMAAGVPLPAPESFIPTWWPFAFYGIFYWLGWQLKDHPSVLEPFERFPRWILGSCIVLFVAYYVLMPKLELSTLVQDSAARSPWRTGLDALLTSYLSVLLTLGALAIGKRWLNRHNSLLKILADASYWVYLIHLPIVLFLQTLLIPVPWSIWIKLPAVILGTLLPCAATYFVFVRYTPLGWLLHGKRSFP